MKNHDGNFCCFIENWKSEEETVRYGESSTKLSKCFGREPFFFQNSIIEKKTKLYVNKNKRKQKKKKKAYMFA